MCGRGLAEAKRMTGAALLRWRWQPHVIDQMRLRSTWAVAVMAATLANSCGGSSSRSGNTSVGCPALATGNLEAMNAKVADDLDHLNNGDIALPVILTLKNNSVEVPGCGDNADRCAERDLFLHERTKSHDELVGCVTEEFGGTTGRRWWYNETHYLTSGEPVAKVLAIGMSLLGRTI